MPWFRNKKTGSRRFGPTKKGVVGRSSKASSSFLDRRFSVRDIAVQAWKTGKYIKSLINVEKDFFDVVVAPAAVTTTASVTNLTNIAQGDDFNNRQGNSILLQSLLLRMSIAGNISATVTGSMGSFVRCIVFQDNDQRGTDPTAAELLEDTTAGVRQILSPLNHNVYKRFNVLVDEIFDVGQWIQTATQAVVSNPMFQHYKVFKNFAGKGMHVRYTATAGADASNFEGSMYLLLVSSDGTSSPTVGFNSRIRYTDN